MSTYKALDIAEKILAKGSSSDSEEWISNLKLQKLLYYMQGFHLAVFEEPLFNDEIEAWMYGPVVPEIYKHFQDYKNQGIPFDGTAIELTPKEEALFEAVYKVYSKYSAIGLMDMTHSEMPWRTTSTGKGSVIAKEKLRTFFKKRLK